MSTLVTIWPNSDDVVDDWPIRGSGASTRFDALESFGEEAWVQADPDGPGDDCTLVCGMQSYTLLANERCYGIRLTVRRDQDGAGQAGWETSLTSLGVGDLLDSFAGTGPRITQAFNWKRYRLQQTDIDNIRLKLYAQYPSVENIYWTQGQLDIYTKPTITSVTAPTGAQASRIVTTTWTPNYQGGGSYTPNPGYATIKFFKSATYGAGGFDPETQPSDGPTFVVNDNTASTSARSYTPPNVNANFLGDGTWKAYVKVSQNHLVIESGNNVFRPYDSDWSASPAFTITSPPPVPTNITPASGSTVNTDIPTLGATVIQPTLLATSRIEWQLATDAGFTANVRNELEETTDLRLSGTTSEVLAEASALFQGAGVPRTWFIRARQVDQFGTAGTWSAGHSFSVSHPPAPASIAPTAGVSVGTDTGDDGEVAVTWVFSDTSPVDFQTAFQLIAEYVSDGSTLHDSGKVIDGDSEYSFTVDNSDIDTELRLKIRLYDRDDVVGSYSAYQLFMVQEFPIVEIAAPVENDVVEVPTPEVEWAVTASLGRVQSRYRVLFGLGPSATPGAAFFDSGWIDGDDTSWTPALPVLETGEDYWVEVQVYDDENLFGSDRNYFFTSWVGPSEPSFTVDVSPYDLSGYVLVEWDDTNIDVDFYSWRLYRSPAGEDEWTLINERTDVDTEYSYHDWLPGSGTEYDWKLVQAAIRFGAIVEGDGDFETDTPIGTHYWLFHPDEDERDEHSLRIRHVTKDSMTEEYENTIIHLIGRGRHQDIGDRFGYAGTLSAELWDDELGLTGREQRLALEAMRATRVELYLRNPFGDVFKVATGDISIERQAGVGRREFSTVGLDYTEVAQDE